MSDNTVASDVAYFEVTINGMKIAVPSGCTVMQACELAEIEIPRFCYHDRLAIAGNCRMCLVEVEGGPPKPVASCAMPISNGMVIHTNTPKVKSAREGVMEFLLLNHPLDCPVCDQGGECDLQDQAMAYGKTCGRSEESRRAVPKKDFGPLIATEMTRCIHCTRCIRFLSDVVGVKELDTIGRGEDMEIATYIGKSITSELSANIIDLCPVGALTAKPYAFTFRSWELHHSSSVDVLDAVGSAIRVDTFSGKVVRILPRLNEDVNEEWISDKTRFACDGLTYKRLDRPYIKRNSKLEEATWDDALKFVSDKIKSTNPDKVSVLAGDLVDCESMLLLKKIMKCMHVNKFECRQDYSKIKDFGRASYIFNTTISGIDSATFCLLIGTNIKLEAPIINARIRKRYLAGNFDVAVIGENNNLSYPVNYLGSDLNVLKEILASEHKISEQLKNSKNPIIIIGQDALSRNDGLLILEYVTKIAEKFNVVNELKKGFNVLHKAAARVGALDLGYIYDGGLNDMIAKSEVLYLLGADEVDVKKINDNVFVVYQGHHGDCGAQNADVILPGAAYTEKNGIYVNTEGRAQKGYKVVSPPGLAKNDVDILFELVNYLGVSVDVFNFNDLRNDLCNFGEHFLHIGSIIKEKYHSVYSGMTDFDDELFVHNKFDFYATDPISRSSKTMKKCRQHYDKFNFKNS